MFLSISVLTLVISFILLGFNWKINRNASYLALIFIIFANYGITHYFSLYGKSAFWLAICYTHFSPLWLLPGPLLYFYVRGTLTDKRGLQWKDSWHFIPSIIHLISILPYVMQPFSYKLEIAQSIINNMDMLKHVKASWLYPSMVSFFLRTSILLIYVLYTAKMLWDFNSSKKEFPKILQKQYQISFKWLILLHISIFITAVSFLVITIAFSKTKVTSELVSAMPVHFISGIAFLLMSTGLLLFPEVLYGISINDSKTQISTAKKQDQEIGANKPTRKTLAIKEEEPFIELADSILKHLEKKKPYLNPNFSLTDLSLALKVPQHHVSYCFNNIIKTKFTNLKTQLRVTHAKSLLKKGSAADLSIDGIGKESGFASKSSFYSAFKAETGLTPNEFLNKK
ncbi:MAG: helix-turn-helix domain-containing protein [Sphingobacteriaceae bacterium]